MNYETAALAKMVSKNRIIHHETDLFPMMAVRYIGAQASGLFGVIAAAEGFTFAHGVLASEIADTTIQVGSTPGSIDVSNAAANTMGEVVDVINASANWEARLIGALRTDVPNAGGTSFVAYAAAQAKSTNGLLVRATSAVDDRACIGAFTGAWNALTGGNPFESSANNTYSLLEIDSTVTHGGVGLFSVYMVDETTDVETLLFSVVGAATTVLQTINLFNGEGGLTADKGKIFKIRTAATALTAGVMEAHYNTAQY